MLKVIFTGPECSGKTTLSTAIAKKNKVPLVKEYARTYLKNLDRNYNYSDLLKIAKGQVELEKKYIDSECKILICDTNLQVIKIWSETKYSKCDEWILKNEDSLAYYVLCSPDFKWHYDSLRESKNERDQLFKKYHEDLVKNSRRFIIAQGGHEKRMALIEPLIRKMIQ